MAEKRKISLVLADVDGTLVTEETMLTADAGADHLLVPAEPARQSICIACCR
jgi:hypothetical protein